MATAENPIVTESIENGITEEDPVDEDVILSGSLTKEGGTKTPHPFSFLIYNYFLGGVYRTWKKRHFVLAGTTLTYYKNEGDQKPKGSVDLTEGRGVRTKDQTKGVEWPDGAKKSLSFGLAVTGRTYYFYGSDPKEVRSVKIELL